MKQRALIDINMILDTRYGALRRLDESAAATIVRSDWYRIRDTDNFEEASNGHIKNADFKAIYEKMEVETLAKSVFTDYVYEQRQDVKEAYGRMERLSPGSSIVLDINCWPYDLLPVEMEMIKRGFARYMPVVNTTVNAVSIDPKTLTPEYLSNGYEMIAFYNYEDWLRHHLEALKTTPIPEITLMTVRIAPSGVVPEPDEVIGDPFSALPLLLMESLKVIVLPTNVACYNYKVYEALVNQSSTSM